MDITRRDFNKIGCKVIIGAVAGTTIIESMISNTVAAENSPVQGGYDWEKHFWGYVVDTTKCIGCGRCANACKLENKVPFDEEVYRTWVERYRIKKTAADTREEEIVIDSPNGGIDGFEDDIPAEELNKAFYVPKLCNHCDNAPCVQVCPVGATYETKDGVVLVDFKYCIGCRYCIQGCPYGARYFNTEKGTADKCTWCYHRITKGLLPACVQACPTGARKFGDLNDENSEVKKIIDVERINLLKPDLGTKPKVFYVGLDREVK
jgi:tetrathionate reductase subunit B